MTPFSTCSARERARRAAGFWAVFGACLALLILRGWDRITHPELFAEGVKFVGTALNDGPASLLAPYDLYFHTAPKLIALVAVSLVRVEDIPLFTNLACYAVTAAAMACISRPCYRWVIPSDMARAALALVMVLAPGLVEILGGLANLHWSLLLFLAVLLLKDPAHPLRLWELALASLTALTAAASIVFLPAALLRLVLAGRRPGAVPGSGTLKGEAALFAILFLVTAFLFGNFITRDANVGFEGLDIVAAARGLDDLLPHLGALFTTFYFLHPFLGTQNTTVFLETAPFYPLVAAASTVTALMMVRLARILDRSFWLIPAYLASMLLLAVMLSMVRYWSFYGVFSFPYENWWFRYNFIFASTGLIFWFALLRAGKLVDLGSWSSVLTLVLLGAYVFQAPAVTTSANPPHHRDAFAIKRYDDRRYWSRTAPELERSLRTGCPAEVEMAGAPAGKWTFVYRSPTAAGDCPEE